MPTVPRGDAAQLNLIGMTPHRHTRLMCGMPEYRKTQESASIVYRAGNMANLSGQPAGQNVNVALLPSGSWCVASWEMMLQFERTEANGNCIPADDGSGLPPGTGAESTFATGFKSFVSAGQIPGVTYAPTATNPSRFARKRKDAASDWHAELTADYTAFPPPQPLTANAALRRIAKVGGPGSTLFGPNQPVYLRFLGPASPLSPTDAFLAWYFGGKVSTTWKDPAITTSGGEFCMIFYGSGMVQLSEATAPAGSSTPWRVVDTWQWETPGKIANQQHLICVLPEGRDTLNFVGTGIEHVFVSDSVHCGYEYKAAVTGVSANDAGVPNSNMRLDLREDLRIPFQYGRQSFPIGGTGGSSTNAYMFGVPFRIPWRLAAGTSIIPVLDFLHDPGGDASRNVVVTLYDANTKTALTGPGMDGGYPTITGSQRDYYARYAFQCPDLLYTPFLRGVEFKVAGSRELFTPTPYTGGRVMEVSITGPDVEIDCDTATALVEDEMNVLSDGPAGLRGLETHADIHCQIQTTWDPNDETVAESAKKRWVLFDGTLVKAPGLRVGKDLGGGDTQYPSKRWKQYSLQLQGMWARLSAYWQFPWAGADWSRDPAGTIDPKTGLVMPWKVTDVIKNILNQAGFDDTQIHLTEPPGATTPPRLFGNGKDPWFMLPAEKTVANALHHLLDYYLGAKLIWDKEALPHGRWLTVYPPALTGTYPSLYTFRTEKPTPDDSTPLSPVHMLGAWPAGTTFISKYSMWVTPPEANYFVVATMPGNPMPGHDPLRAPGQNTRPVKDNASYCTAVGANWRSFDVGPDWPDADPSHIDYVPYGIKPFILIEPSLWCGTIEQTNEACRFVCRRLMNAGAYGKRWFQWLAPLVAYFDPDEVYGGGPRTLRTYDTVEINEDGNIRTVILTSCNPQIGLPEGDLCQWAEYTGYMPPVPLSY